MNSWAGEVGGGSYDWYQNSHRFGTEDEAKHFIDQLKELWIPKGFIRTTRTKRSKDPVNARWDDEKKEVVGLNVEAATTFEATVTVDATEEDEIPTLINEKSYRNNINNRRKKRLRRIFNREAYRNYKDETRWYDKEQQTLFDEALRHDIRHLMSHGACHFELSRHLYEEFKAAHEGKAPEDMATYAVRERPEHGNCRYGIDQQIFQIKEDYDDVWHGRDSDGPHYEVSEHLTTKSINKLGIKLLKTKSLAKLVSFAKENGVDGADKMRRNELIHEILKQQSAENNLYFFELGDPVGAGSEMQELTGWLDSVQGHACVGWYSFGEWHGPPIMKDLTATRLTWPRARPEKLEIAIKRARKKLASVRRLIQMAARPRF